MAMTFTDTLPEDAGTQKFVGPVDDSNEQFTAQRALNIETVSAKEYADAGVSAGQSQTVNALAHDAASITTSETVSAEIEAWGYKRIGIFLDVGAGADIQLRVYGRFVSAGDNYLLALVEDGQAESTKQMYVVEIAAMYILIGLQAKAASATCSCNVRFFP